ncbi:MAG: dihydroorotase [Planctomycetaceae bacterium]|nr:dihydroorotase [Planctomycetaceae bacterium]
MAVLIKKGRIVDPAQKLDAEGDVLIAGGKVIACGKVGKEALKDALRDEELREIDAHGLIVSPGWVDMHAHLREPGDEQAETIRSGARAAARGGFTTVACLPDTNPPIDSESGAEYVRLQSERADGADVFPICALTKGCKGESLAELGQLSKAGAVAFSDTRPMERTDLLLKGLKYASMFDRIVSDIPRDPFLGRGVMNSGAVATLAGLSGSPAVAEELAVVRGCLLARESGGAWHAAHISTAGAVRQMAHGKQEKLRVSCAVSPVNLLLTDEEIRERYDTRYKLRPPLRSQSDIEALLKGIESGIVDCIVSAHAPVSDERKDMEFDLAPFGGSTIEIALAATLEVLVHQRGMSISRVIELGSARPAELLRMKGRKGTLAPGADGDVALIDPKKKWKVDSSAFISKSHVCPIDGATLRGQVAYTIVRGNVFEMETAVTR